MKKTKVTQPRNAKVTLPPGQSKDVLQRTHREVRPVVGEP